VPTYTPHLNLIERRWRYVKEKFACHRWWNDLDHPMWATETLLSNREVHFHAEDGPTFRPRHNFCQSA
jgi:hypothetical protein